MPRIDNRQPRRPRAVRRARSGSVHARRRARSLVAILDAVERGAPLVRGDRRGDGPHPSRPRIGCLRARGSTGCCSTSAASATRSGRGCWRSRPPPARAPASPARAPGPRTARADRPARSRSSTSATATAASVSTRSSPTGAPHDRAVGASLPLAKARPESVPCWGLSAAGRERRPARRRTSPRVRRRGLGGQLRRARDRRRLGQRAGLGPDGAILAAVSVSAPESRPGPARVRRAAPAVTRADGRGAAATGDRSRCGRTDR